MTSSNISVWQNIFIRSLTRTSCGHPILAALRICRHHLCSFLSVDEREQANLFINRKSPSSVLCLWVAVLGDKSVLLFLLSRSVLPLFQHGFAGVLLHLRLPARDQSQAPRGDRSTVRKPTLFLRRLGLGRGTAGRVHPGQRFKLPSVRQRRIWCGLEELDKSERVFPLLQWCLTETYRGVRSVIDTYF